MGCSGHLIQPELVRVEAKRQNWQDKPIPSLLLPAWFIVWVFMVLAMIVKGDNKRK